VLSRTVEAGDGQVLRHPRPARRGRLQDADRDLVVEAGHGFQAYGVGVYCFFNLNPGEVSANALTSPTASGVQWHDMDAKTLEQVATGQYVDEGDERDNPEQGPRDLDAGAQVGTRCEVDPHQDYCHRVKETEQDFHQLLHGTSKAELNQELPCPGLAVANGNTGVGVRRVPGSARRRLAAPGDTERDRIVARSLNRGPITVARPQLPTISRCAAGCRARHSK
jgi:hypothetical protein